VFIWLLNIQGFFPGNMQKPKKYNWKDSNMALFGYDLEKNVRAENFCYAVGSKLKAFNCTVPRAHCLPMGFTIAVFIDICALFLSCLLGNR